MLDAGVERAVDHHADALGPAREVLPAGYTFAWSGLAFEEKQSGGTSTAAFVFGLIIVFLVLAAQYESWTLPGAVMTAVPFGILGAREYERLARLQFDGGVAPYMTVLQAQQALFPAELNEVQTRASLFASTVNVYKAMGGGWIAEAEQRTR